MKLTSMTVVSAVSALAGCATPAPTSSVAAYDIDYARVNAINNVARAQGVQVHWINLPQKVKVSNTGKPGGAG